MYTNVNSFKVNKQKHPQKETSSVGYFWLFNATSLNKTKIGVWK